MGEQLGHPCANDESTQNPFDTLGNRGASKQEVAHAARELRSRAIFLNTIRQGDSLDNLVIAGERDEPAAVALMFPNERRGAPAADGEESSSSIRRLLNQFQNCSIPKLPS